MSRRSLSRIAAPVALAVLMVLSVAAPALACGDRLAERVADGAERTTTTTASAIVPGSVNRTSLKLSATYSVGATLRYASRYLNVNTVATITNTSGGPIDRVEMNTIAARLGGMRLTTVQVDERIVARRVSDQTVIVPLGGILPAGDTVKVRVHYVATLRSSLAGSNWMFTRVNGIVDAYRWIPWVSRATPFTRPNHGDPFVTPVSPEIRLTLRTDRRLVVASTADRVSITADGLTQRLVARNVRDVTLTAAPDFRIATVAIGDKRVKYYYRSTANRGLIVDAAADAFRTMQARLGTYPYPIYKVVQSAGGYGMESPGLTWIPYGVSSANLRYLLAHETAHQWFYGLVGNDQARQPFADEAVADFLARDVTGTRRASRCSTGRLDRSIYSYTAACYYEIVYIQGGNLLHQARSRMGSTRFYATLKQYVADRRYGISTTKTLLQTLDDATSVNLSTLFAPRFPSFY
jgi:hypothetical protein